MADAMDLDDMPRFPEDGNGGVCPPPNSDAMEEPSAPPPDYDSMDHDALIALLKNLRGDSLRTTEALGRQEEKARKEMIKKQREGARNAVREGTRALVDDYNERMARVVAQAREEDEAHAVPREKRRCIAFLGETCEGSHVADALNGGPIQPASKMIRVSAQAAHHFLGAEAFMLIKPRFPWAEETVALADALEQDDSHSALGYGGGVGCHPSHLFPLLAYGSWRTLRTVTSSRRT